MEILPKGAWFGLTRQRLRRLGVAVIAILIALFLTWLGLFAFINWKAHQLTQLDSELRKLRVNQSTFAEVRRLEDKFSDLMNYASCSGRECQICLTVDWYVLLNLQGHGERLDEIIRKLYELLDNPALSRLGIRMWYANAIITVVDDKVGSYSLRVSLEEPDHDWMLAGWTMYNRIPHDDLDFYKTLREKENYFVHWTHLHVGMETGEGLLASVAQDATLEDQWAAQHIEMHCLTSLRPCTTLCEFFPEAARYHDHLTERSARSAKYELRRRCSD